MAERDYIAEMNTVIDDLVRAPGVLVPTVAATELVARLRQTDPKLLSGWLSACAEALLTEAILRRNQSKRRKDRYEHDRTDFAAAAAEGALGVWRFRFLLADGGQQYLSRMTLDDCRWLAGYYQRTGDSLIRRGRFFEQLATDFSMRSQQEADTVAVVFSESEVADLWTAIVEPD